MSRHDSKNQQRLFKALPMSGIVSRDTLAIERLRFSNLGFSRGTKSAGRCECTASRSRPEIFLCMRASACVSPIAAGRYGGGWCELRGLAPRAKKLFFWKSSLFLWRWIGTEDAWHASKSSANRLLHRIEATERIEWPVWRWVPVSALQIRTRIRPFYL